jgi:MSHA pilin protein MshA
MNKNFKVQAQGGFTLIELIVVIVILGILAATALPKFASLGGDARAATINAAKGSISSAAAMSHGKYLVNPSAFASGSLPTDGITVTVTTNGYPTAADTGIQAAAGLDANDFHMYVNTDTGANIPNVVANQVAFVPASLVGTPAAKKCYVSYKMVPPTTAQPIQTPAVAMDTSGCE